MDTEKKQPRKTTVEHLSWAIAQRKEVQDTLLALYEFIEPRRYEHTASVGAKLGVFIGVAFSLWRAAFLADTPRDGEEIFNAQKNFLYKVISDNSIAYPDDKANRAWAAEYYLENAEFRLGPLIKMSSLSKPAKGELNELLGEVGEGDVEFTQYRWEAAHYVLRRLLTDLDAGFALPAAVPKKVEEKGLSRFFSNEEGPEGPSSDSG